ncbi:MAG: DUF262 domain-containing protein [Proteobacteria bacterium]|nr:DUF262 domain-containing protein [Pseudomonadota bacterium]
MKAQDRTVKDWITNVRAKKLGLPRFQRFEAWGPAIITDFLTSVIRGLPVGVSLILEVGNKPQFKYRYFAGIPESGENLKELLLDGQQRLTALWRCLTDNYDDKTYLIDLDTSEDKDISAMVVSRWVHRKNSLKYPLWVDNPSECWEREKVPFGILNPDDSSGYIKWCEQASNGDKDKQIELITTINDIRNNIAQFNIPYLYLSAETPPEVAIDVFIKLNTSYVRLTAFDIIVAQVEEATDQSLHQKVRELEAEAPEISDYIDTSTYVLSVATLLQDRLPNQRGFFSLDLVKMIDEWEKIVDGTKELVAFLEEQKIFDNERLPTETILAPIAAVFSELPDDQDRKGNIKTLMKKYLWSAFFTDRYDRSIPTRILQDFRGIKKFTDQGIPENEIPIFDEKQFPLPTEELLEESGWPKKKDRLARGILLLSLRKGAKDFADNSEVNRRNIKIREYHHLYPAALLNRQGVDENTASKALNCALITWKTNRTISDKDPLTYLKDRTNASHLGEKEIEHRLSTHLVDYEMLKAGDYKEYIEHRAKELKVIIDKLCKGIEWD